MGELVKRAPSARSYHSEPLSKLGIRHSYIALIISLSWQEDMRGWANRCDGCNSVSRPWWLLARLVGHSRDVVAWPANGRGALRQGSRYASAGSTSPYLGRTLSLTVR